MTDWSLDAAAGHFNAPIPGSYWVIPGLLLAGEYPGSRDPNEVHAKLSSLLRSGIARFIDLTEPDEGLSDYWPVAQAHAAEARLKIVRHRLSIRDMSIPTRERMVDILATIDQALAERCGVYVHCWGGIGRTGTVVGCYLVERGLDGDAALERLERLRRHTPDAGRPSPETAEQRAFVLAWNRRGE